jgi:hypothetical protein
MRNIKMLGLLAVAAMALAAFVGTSSASATAFTAGGAGETINHTTIEDHVFTITGAEVSCETVDFNGTTAGASVSEQILSPSYDDCEAFGFAEAEVVENGCDWLTKAATTGSPGHATKALVNCANKTTGIRISVNVPFFANCTMDVPEQSIDTAERYTNLGNNAERVDYTPKVYMADVTSSTGFCPLTTGTHSGANGGTMSGASQLTTEKGYQYSP